MSLFGDSNSNNTVVIHFVNKVLQQGVIQQSKFFQSIYIGEMKKLKRQETVALSTSSDRYNK